jgi:putative nucleotidyltransferase with HDIG domain
LLNQITLASIVDNINRLPSLPSVVNELIVALGNKSVNVDELAHGIEKDQALSARALRVANSPFYGVRQPIGSIHDAIVVLGFRAVSSLVTTAALTNFFKVPELAWFDQSTFWRKSLGTAVCCRKMASLVGMDPEVGFTAGLLHDIGRLILVVCCPKQYQAVMVWRAEQDCFLFDAEKQILGVSHTQAGEALAKHWNFAPVVRDAIAYHHTPPASSTATMVDLVHVADILAQALDMARDPQNIVSKIDPAAWQRLGLDWDRLNTVLPGIEHEFESYDTLLA